MFTLYHVRTDIFEDERFIDPFSFPQGRSTWPNDVDSPEHGYMKLPNRKILRIRRTIYEDPGNPFADEVNFEHDTSDSAAFNEQVTQVPVQDSGGATSSIATKAEVPKHRLDMAPRPFESFEIPRIKPSGPISHGHKLPSDVRNHRRSKSVAIPATGSMDQSNDVYVAPRTFWRRETLPTTQTQMDVDRINNARDTKFYGFYDDLIGSYSRSSREL